MLRRARIMVLRSSLSNRSKIWMGHGLFGCESFLEIVNSSSYLLAGSDTYLVVVSEQLVEEVNGVVANEPLVVCVDK